MAMTARAALPAEPRIVIPAIAADGSLYPIEKLEAHQLGVRHLAVSVFVFCEGKLLIQQRAAGKYHCAGAWANTCCTHPHWGESLHDAAIRRLREELGVQLPLMPRTVIDYEADVSDGLREVERVQVYEGQAEASALALAPDPGEVAATRWISVQAAKADAKARPELYAPWFRIYLSRWDELGLHAG